MSQEVSTKHNTSDTYSSPTPIEPFSADDYADKLMDELFSDIYQVLDDGSKLPNPTVKPEYVSLQPIVIPPITLPEEVTAHPEDPSVQADNKLNASQPPGILERTQKKSDEQPRRFGSWFDKLLLVLAVTSLAGMIIMWLAYYHKLNWRLVHTQSAPAVTPTPISASDAKFSEYMLRSLQAIEHKYQVSKQPVTAPGVQPTTKDPHIPLYSPPPVSYSPPPPLSTVTSPKPAGTPQIATPSKPVPSPQATSPLPQPSSVPKAAPLQNNLVATIERGDNSAALVQINGITERIHLGEDIGNTGWILVAVAKDEAIIRRNGEVRSVYVGQKF